MSKPTNYPFYEIHPLGRDYSDVYVTFVENEQPMKVAESFYKVTETLLPSGQTEIKGMDERMQEVVIAVYDKPVPAPPKLIIPDTPAPVAPVVQQLPKPVVVPAVQKPAVPEQKTSMKDMLLKVKDLDEAKRIVQVFVALDKKTLLDALFALKVSYTQNPMHVIKTVFQACIDEKVIDEYYFALDERIFMDMQLDNPDTVLFKARQQLQTLVQKWKEVGSALPAGQFKYISHGLQFPLI